MKTLNNQLKALWKDESAQGATEYILLLVAIVALVMLFKEQLIGENGVIRSLIGRVSGDISKF